MFSVKKFFLLICFCFLPFTALAQAEEFSFSPMSEITVINAGSMEIISDYAPASADNIDISISPTPRIRIQDWLSQHFKVSGEGSNVLKFVITDASVLEDYTPPEGFSLSSVFTYKARFAVNAYIVNPDGENVASFISKVWGTKSIQDSSTIEERIDVLSEMTDTLVGSLAEQIKGGVNTTFAKYVKSNIM